MADLFRIESRLKGKLFDEKAVDKAFAGAIDLALAKALVILEGAIKEKTPVGVSGHLRGSIATELRGSRISRRGVVGSPLVYAPVLELGRKAAPVPIAPLRLWVERKLGIADKTESLSVAIAISRSKARKRTPGLHMFRDAFEENRARVQGILNGVVDEIAGELNG